MSGLEHELIAKFAKLESRTQAHTKLKLNRRQPLSIRINIHKFLSHLNLYLPVFACAFYSPTMTHVCRPRLAPPSSSSIHSYRTLAEQHKFFTFETKQKEEIASLVASYSPNLSNWMRKGNSNSSSSVPTSSVEKTNQGGPAGQASTNGTTTPAVSTNHQPTPGNRRLLKMSLEDRMKFHQELVNTRKVKTRMFVNDKLSFVAKVHSVNLTLMAVPFESVGH